MSKQNNRLVLKIIVFAGKLFLLFKMYSIIVLKEVMFMNFKEVLNKYLKELVQKDIDMGIKIISVEGKDNA